MSANDPSFQALPGATPENSAFIDLYFDTSVRLYFTTHVNLLVNGWQVRLPYEGSIKLAVPPGPVSVVVDCFTAFLSPKPRLQFAVQPGQMVPVFYRASILQGDPGALSFGKLRGMSRSEKGSLIFALVVLLMILMTALPIALVSWFAMTSVAP
ncbi:hypothetical protein E4J66_03965 [Actinomyces viscosus]|uniref:Uncharacterized protein n=1 Tax=Actinomyces viscosus TaxID=1656 RepID=A0A448PP18_ACTVI|nr:hypothetical protein [Actinomyces viscosus]TFH53278.1 hypothetical protein E4J66_03965 [Actinomyces viscosus]VEI18132.1 Uncharacterised protein [Actinomyces viscosus]